MKQPPAALRLVGGCFRWVWRVQDSNLGRLSRRIYSPLPLATRATRRHVAVTTLRRIADSAPEGDIGSAGPSVALEPPAGPSSHYSVVEIVILCEDRQRGSG